MIYHDLFLFRSKNTITIFFSRRMWCLIAVPDYIRTLVSLRSNYTPVIQICYYDFQTLANQYVALFQNKRNWEVKKKQNKETRKTYPRVPTIILNFNFRYKHVFSIYQVCSKNMYLFFFECKVCMQKNVWLRLFFFTRKNSFCILFLL